MNSFDELGYVQKSQEDEAKSIQILSKLWAKKYVQKLIKTETVWETNSKGIRTITAQRLLESLRSASAQAWTKTESLLSQEVKRHGINYKLIDPWEIAKDVHFTYEKLLLAYAAQLTPRNVCVSISSDLGLIRQKYANVDPRVISFVSMQFHYTGQLLLQPLSPQEQANTNDYFKIIDDNLYMPLQRLYEAAANYDYYSPVLETIRQILPASNELSRKIVMRIIELNPSYCCYSGSLGEPHVKSSSIRDVEMFQIYLWVCVLEKSIAAIQHELFPLCVMLYPTLKVRWELVRQMIHLIGVELRGRLKPLQVSLFRPYFQALWEMFSPEVFPDSLDNEGFGNSGRRCYS
ncbi:MAG: hypothetical protein ICV63_07330 [Coleofasciculus sp. Co-bin14]|nr:hypothetical protein [Coleofasciculus sp. Co-bin14]